jgi:hypothetical protein
LITIPGVARGGGVPKNEHMFDAWQAAQLFPPDIMQENREAVGELDESAEAGRRCSGAMLMEGLWQASGECLLGCGSPPL